MLTSSQRVQNLVNTNCITLNYTYNITSTTNIIVFMFIDTHSYYKLPMTNNIVIFVDFTFVLSNRITSTAIYIIYPRKKRTCVYK